MELQQECKDLATKLNGTAMDVVEMHSEHKLLFHL